MGQIAAAKRAQPQTVFRQKANTILRLTEILLSLSEAAPPRKAAKRRRSAQLPETRKDAERRHRAPMLSHHAVSVPRSRPLAGML